MHLSCNETIPADMVVLKSSDEHSGLCYIDTQNLDGEANLKQRQVPRGMVDEVRKDTMPIIEAQSFTSIDGRSPFRLKTEVLHLAVRYSTLIKALIKHFLEGKLASFIRTLAK